VVNFNVPTRTVSQQVGDVMVILTAMIRQTKLAVVSFLPLLTFDNIVILSLHFICLLVATHFVP